MKIGILTFHEVYNPGAFLQALATQRLVESLGHEALIINYTPKSHRYSFARDLRNLKWRLPIRFPRAIQNLRKDKAFAADREKWMNLTAPFETAEQVASESFDAVLIGADVVWNFTIKQYGHDPLYFGIGLNTKKRISFAPSFGPCSINDNPPPYVQQGLNQFDLISVRDQNTKEIVSALTEVDPPIICDPAFHLDLTKLPLEDEGEQEPYLLVYMLGVYVSKESVNQIRSFAKKNNLRIVGTMYHLKWVDENRCSHGPIQWLHLIKNAAFVVTNTFHGIVFCSKMQKKFAFEYTPSIQSKSLYTVEKLGIAPLLIDENSTVESVLESDFKFDGVRQQIVNLTNEGKRFLVNALSVEENIE